ncbi:uncharacterized protein I206_100738 [Kwoniella pini CBS 10737]|uniref:Uncharacterized protein n=1 Tax=Kwoniella pini CBS 10737 TaxID=1296096 RepID=A0A1B9ICA3_9TREE|nr:uncharacterized protein I206_00589 [Kwoniella pini CBS 10737]OCF53288.1 hypothetical protein I206_00589 [Kwoniella pini CBS 10737]
MPQDIRISGNRWLVLLYLILYLLEFASNVSAEDSNSCQNTLQSTFTESNAVYTSYSDSTSTTTEYFTSWLNSQQGSTFTDITTNTTWVNDPSQNALSLTDISPTTTIPFEAPLTVSSSEELSTPESNEPSISTTMTEDSSKSQKPSSTSAETSTSSTEKPPKPTTDMQALSDKAREECTEFWGCFAVIQQSDKVKVDEIGVPDPSPRLGPGFWYKKLDNQAPEYNVRSFRISIDVTGKKPQYKECNYTLMTAPKDIFISVIVTETEPYFELEGMNDKYLKLGDNCAF